MKYRRLGKSNLEVSLIGLGTLALGGQAYGSVNDADSIAAIHRALELGINFIDTSDNYGLGRAEEVVGKAIGARRAEVILATKGGTPWDEQGRMTSDCRAKTITKAVQESLRRLGTDWIDLYQIHLPDPETPFEETARALEKLIRAGKIRYVGLSNFWAANLEEWLSSGEVVANQMPYNLLHRDIEDNVIPLCREKAIGVIAYTPLLMGLFAGRMAGDFRLGEGDHRSAYPQFQGEPLRQSLTLVDRLRSLAQELGLTMAQLALRWAISRPGVTCAIPGAKRPTQVEESAGAGERVLKEEELKEIDRILDETQVETPRAMPMKVTEVREGPRGKVGVLEMGIKVKIPASVQAGDRVEMDVVTGQVVKAGEAAV